MRRANRNIEIFSMSVLDMFASALGAFIIISVILFPYYNQAKQLEQARENIVKTDDMLGKAKAILLRSQETSKRLQEEINKGSQFRTALVACESKMSACKAALTKVFLVIGMEWEDSCDVDLYVTVRKADLPQGSEGVTYSYAKRTNPPSKAELSLDMRDGPGIEVWQNPEAEPGEYAIKYQQTGRCPALGQAGDSITVKGWVLDRSSGTRKLQDVVLTYTKHNADVAVVRVSSDGLATIQPPEVR